MSQQGQKLYQHARTRIPGGTQLLSKRPEMFLPDQWPNYYTKAQGAKVWDLDGKRYIDMSISGIGATVLGYADPEVNEAVKKAIDDGSMSTLNCYEEVELADLLCELHPWAHMVRYSRSGGEAMSIAIRIARAYAKRDKIAFCGYHGWHDWYLSANLSENSTLDGHLLPGLQPLGVPRGLTGTMLPFHYNNIEELREIVAHHGSELAAIVMEPVRNEPKEGFLEQVRQIATEIGAVLIFDEITAGWRVICGGIHLTYQVKPDIAVFAKAISNGYPMGAIIGQAEVMQAAQNTFISSTAWTERIGPAASLATIRKYQRVEAAKHLVSIGLMVQQGWQQIAAKTGLNISISGIAPLGHFGFTGYPHGEAMRTLFTQIMLEHGFLAKNLFYAMYAHQTTHVEEYLDAVEKAFTIIAQAVEQNQVEAMLKGPVAHSGFQRLT